MDSVNVSKFITENFPLVCVVSLYMLVLAVGTIVKKSYTTSQNSDGIETSTDQTEGKY